MARGGYRGGKPPTKSITGEPAKMTAFRLVAEALVQLEGLAATLGCSKTAVIERLLAQASATAILAGPDPEIAILRVQLESSQRGRMRLAAELANAKERESALETLIVELQAQIAQAERRWAQGVLHLSEHASARDVNRAFRELAKRYHPDSNPDDPQAARFFRDLVRARDRLLSEP